MDASPSKARPLVMLEAAGWTLLVPVVILSSYLALALGTTLITPEPITATVVLGGIVTALIALVRWRRPAWLAYRPSPAPLKDPRLFWWRVAGCAALAFLAGQTMALWLYSVMGSEGFEESNATRAAAEAMSVVLVLVAAPLSEEALFRGLMYPVLRKRLGVSLSVILSAASFALLHGNIVQITSALPLAVLMALVYERTRRLWPLILAHLGFNLTALLLPPVLLAALVGPVQTIALGLAFGVACAGLMVGAAAQSVTVAGGTGSPSP